MVPTPTNRNYIHWGVYQPGSIAEPNSLVPGENCAVGNATQSYDNAFGWADANCAQQFAFMCKSPGTSKSQQPDCFCLCLVASMHALRHVAVHAATSTGCRCVNC